MTFERMDKCFPFNWHYHPEFELTLIVDSVGQRLVGDGIADYGPGDLVLIGPNLPHSWRSAATGPGARRQHRAVVVQFRGDFLGEHFLALREMAPVRRLLRESLTGLAFGHLPSGRRAALEVARFPLLTAAQRVVSLIGILLELSGEHGAEHLSTHRLRPICRGEDQGRIDKICGYLGKHYTEDIDFDRLASQVHLRQASLCRFFRRGTGRTMTVYVNELRVGAAARLLTDSDASITDIALQVGFGNYSNFNRQFKKIKGITPRKFRGRF